MADTTKQIASQKIDSNQLALDRTHLAHERTLMAWIRTSASLISFGFTIYKFFQYLHESGTHPPIHRVFGPRQFAMFLISIALVSLLFASLQHWQYMKNFRKQYVKREFSMATMVAALISILGVASLIAVIFRQ